MGVTVQGSYQKSCTNTPNKGALPVTSPLLICNTHEHAQGCCKHSEDVWVTAAYHCKVVVVSETSRPCVAVQSHTDDEQEGIYPLMLREHFSKFLRAAYELVICTACQDRSSVRNKPNDFWVICVQRAGVYALMRSDVNTAS